MPFAITPRRLIWTLSALTSACVHIPRESVTLSTELGNRIQESRVTHEQTVRSLVASRRALVDSFLVHEWLPEFARNLLENPSVTAEMAKALGSQNIADRLAFMIGLGTRVQGRLNAKRLELMAPLDQAENAIVDGLEQHYNQMLAVNASLTTLLSSASKVEENDRQLLQMLDPSYKLPSYLNQVDRIVSVIVAGRDSIVKRREEIDSILARIQHPSQD